VSRAALLPRERLIFTIAGLLSGVQHVAVGASSPMPAAGAMLLRARQQALGERAARLSILGSVKHNFFTNGSVELFDCAGQGRVDAFFLGGGQIDGQANINLVGAGAYPAGTVRWPGSFGSAYLYFVVPRVILFREEHSPRVLVDKVDFISAPGVSPPEVHRPGGPHALLTGMALFHFHRERARFVLQSVHAGHTLDDVRAATGFAFDVVPDLAVTPEPDAGTLALMRTRVLAELAETYPEFAARWQADLGRPLSAPRIAQHPVA
jgi:glutaconate CoA-transferase, subunit B